MNTQLNRVLSVLSDGQWHSLPDISQKLAIKKRSAGSRIRDLRLSTYGNHHIEVRKTGHHQIFEYRLTTQNSAPNPSIGNISITTPTPTPTIQGVTSVLIQEWSDLPWHMKPVSTVPVKFLDIQSMQVIYHPRRQCEVCDVGNGFQRLVAMDDSGKIIEHYITTQDNL